MGGGGITALTNGNYVVRSNNWANGTASSAGAATWGNGTSGISGVISSTNSLVGSQTNDYVGVGGVTALTNGNYVVNSTYWAQRHGGCGGRGDVGQRHQRASRAWSPPPTRWSAARRTTSVGSGGVTALTNGNYVVSSSYWDNGAASSAGAVTWGSGTGGISGVVSSANSLVGSTANDQVGIGGITALTNGNYVVRSSYWDNGTAGTRGGDVGQRHQRRHRAWSPAPTRWSAARPMTRSATAASTALTNGNYVVSSHLWDNGAVADGGRGDLGQRHQRVSAARCPAPTRWSAVQPNDEVGNGGVTALTNGNYVVGSTIGTTAGEPKAGAATWGSGASGVSARVQPPTHWSAARRATRWAAPASRR